MWRAKQSRILVFDFQTGITKPAMRCKLPPNLSRGGLLPRSGRNPLQNAALQPQSWLLE
ncbi:hypothetical protein AK812_SmicGene48433, partial [Symbiodinium microadriaticum]